MRTSQRFGMLITLAILITACSRSTVVEQDAVLGSEIQFRQQILGRAEEWLLIEDGGVRDTPIKYSNEPGSGLGGFRADCSGYISYAWDLIDERILKEGGLNTNGLAIYSENSKVPIDGLQPGDILLAALGEGKTNHALIFVGWIDKQSKAFIAYEENGGEYYSRATKRTDLSLSDCTENSCEIIGEGEYGKGPYTAYSHPVIVSLFSDDAQLAARQQSLSDVIQIPSLLGFSAEEAFTGIRLNGSQLHQLLPSNLKEITLSNAASITRVATIGGSSGDQGTTGFDLYREGGIEAVALSPDNRQIAVGTTQGVDIYQIEDWSLFHHIDSAPTLRDIGYISNGEYLWISNHDITVWNTKDWTIEEEIGKAVSPFKGEGRSYFSPDGKWVAIPAFDGFILYEAEAAILHTVSFGNQGTSPNVYEIKFSPDSKLIAVRVAEYQPGGFTPNRVYIYRLEGVIAQSVALEFPEGYEPTLVHYYQVDSLKPMTRIELDETIYEVDFSSDGSMVATYSENRGSLETWTSSFQLWSTLTGRLVNSSTHNRIFGSLSTSSEFMLIVPETFVQQGDYYESKYGPLEIYHVKAESVDLAYTYQTEDCYSGTWNPAGDGILLNCGESLRMMNPSTGEMEEISSEVPNEVLFTKDGTSIIGYWPDRILIWDSGRVEEFAVDLLGTIFSIDISPDSQLLAVGLEDNHVIIWQLSDGEIVLDEHEGVLGHVEFSSNGEYFTAGSGASGSFSFQNTQSVWTVSDWEARRLRAPDDIDAYNTWTNFEFTPDGESLVMFSGTPNQLMIYSLEDLSLDSIVEYDGWSGPIAFSTDGKLMATVVGDSHVDIKNLESNDLQTSFSIDEEIGALIFTPDSQRIIGRNRFGIPVRYYLWSTTSGELLEIAEEVQYIWLPSEGRYVHELPKNWGSRDPSDWLYTEVTFENSIRLRTFAGGGIWFSSGEGFKALSSISIGPSRVSPSGSLLVHTNYSDNNIIISDISGGNRLAQLEVDNRGIVDFGFTPDGELIILAFEAGWIELWGIENLN